MNLTPRFFPVAMLALLLAQGAYAQELVTLTRQDQQSMLVTSYPPKEACRGVVVISPGAGGSEKGYQYLGAAMSSFGYWAVVVGHQESGRRALREHMRGNGLSQGLAALITDPHAYRGRLMDIAAAKQWAAGKCQAGKSVLLGHSMGAATSMIEAGARNKLGVQGADSFDAYIALSPQGVGSIFPQHAWADINKPVLSLTGTRDQELGGASWQTRTEPFNNMSAGCKWLGVIDGATHMNFAGNGMAERTKTLSTQVIAAFLNGLELGDCKAPRGEHDMDIRSK